ncbi:post-transcriptional regulator [Neobacillus thermocopriae]|uniref:Post-transcriptional regulator n=1 Tax=Neobacillus thermocopriae TaxID=1215031 RepID=A0A6B3TSQ8_9BACI|nr:post-transcriptional regulator [Neobacillus thermocopriae]MED3624463.1 post-transcriptional regulator [Neobacillus thermocopriae]MED3715349.1 post-transcriptional regulator [Neobacillus thermocopriae]NEX79548.1 post-transcriptional regulator [Neobacillus thermocopriae]
MGIIHTAEQYRSQVQPAILSKLEEFRLLGTDSVTEDDLWEFLMKKKWRKEKKDELKLFEMIQDILSVKVSDYISFATIESFKKNEFSLDDKNEWEDLLK